MSGDYPRGKFQREVSWEENVKRNYLRARWPVLSLTISSSQQQCTVNVLIIDELTRGAGGTEIFTQISALVQ